MVRKWVWGWALLLANAAYAGDEGVTPGEIRLGASQVLSGPLGPQTVQYGEGARLLFDAVNAAGGVHGRKISFTTLDDGFDPKRAVENPRKLIEEQKVFMLFNSTGTAQAAAVLPILKETKTILFGPVTGASSMRAGVNPHLIHVRTGYANETERILSQLKQIGVTRVAFFYQDDSLGKTLLGEVKKA
jgi:branched-chain amino acid transport system substrate-binding protein